MSWKKIKKIFKKRKEPLNHKMLLKSRDLGNGSYEINGVVIPAESHEAALMKYRRAKND